MKRFCELYNIRKYNTHICITDVIQNVLKARNKSYYIKKINEENIKLFNNVKFITKTTLVEFLSTCKSEEAKIAIDVLKNKKNSLDDRKIDIDVEAGVMIYGNHNITINTVNNELWIRAKDITSLLGFGNTRDAVSKYVDEEDLCKQYKLDGTDPRANSPLYVNESGFYALVLNSNHKQSKQIKRWVTKTVLPTIRKTGAYNHADELKKLQIENQILEDRIVQLKNPKTIKVKKTKEPIPKAVRMKVWNLFIGTDKATGKCFCCRDRSIDQQEFQCGHVVSEYDGGRVTIQNLRPICGLCNSSMGTKNMIEWMTQYGFDIEHIVS